MNHVKKLAPVLLTLITTVAAAYGLDLGFNPGNCACQECPK